MRKQIRRNKDGSHYFSFIYFDESQGKDVRVPRAEIQRRFGRDINNEEDAKIVMKLLDAQYENLADKIAKRMEWEKKYYNFARLLETYTKKQMKAAPNSYKNSIHYLKHYVLHYFLNLKACNNLELWYSLYDNFRDWLEDEAKLVKQPNQKISYGTKNHCIKSLNTFMRHLYKNRMISNLLICQKFPTYKLGERTIEDVIKHEEMESVYRNLKKLKHIEEAIFFRMLYFTGMRFNEGLGISIADLFTGHVQDEAFHRTLKTHKINYFGYIILASQPTHETRALRNEFGKIDRKPLKGRKKISEKYARVVIIPDETLWKELITLYNEKVDFFENSRLGDNPSDYALFDEIDRTTSARKLKQAFEKSNLPYRSWHCCRHSCATNIVGKTGDYQLARRWLGHNSMLVIERYIHTHQAMIRKARQTKANNKGFRKIELGAHH